MKMSMENYKKFTDFYNYTVENASDEAVEYIMACIASASAVAMKNIKKANKKNGKN